MPPRTDHDLDPLFIHLSDSAATDTLCIRAIDRLDRSLPVNLWQITQIIQIRPGKRVLIVEITQIPSGEPDHTDHADRTDPTGESISREVDTI